MLQTIPLLTAILFASLYPLSFWISAHDPLKSKFHRFHLGFALFIAGVAVFGVVALKMSFLLTVMAMFWVILLSFITALYWQQDYPHPVVVSIPCLVGATLFFFLHSHFAPMTWEKFFAEILGGLILASATYAMNLGHGYLNVHGLPIHHLKRATYVLACFLLVRLIWDAAALLIKKISYQGDQIFLWQFVSSLDGFLLIVALVFGTIFPLIGVYFVLGTLRVKSTQSATGILYVLLSAILLGDIAYRYHLLKFGIAL